MTETSPADTSAVQGGVYYPPTSAANREWEATSAGDLGWDEDALEEALVYAGEQGSTGFLILHRGKILAERYWSGWDAGSDGIVFSVGKSIAAVLVGIALERGEISLDEPVKTYLGDGWSEASAEQEAAITVRHVLSMTTGLGEDLSFVAPAGTTWFYNSPTYRLIYRVLESATGQGRRAFAKRVLFDPLGMHDTRFSLNGELFVASARDLCRFGLMVLNDGRWDGTEVLPGASYRGEMLSSSQALNPSYGYFWWLNGQSHYMNPGPPPVQAQQGALIPTAPADLVAALGAGDKKVYLVPSADLVVCRHGPNAGEFHLGPGPLDSGLWQRITAAMPKP